MKNPLTLALFLLVWAGSVFADSTVFPKPTITTVTEVAFSRITGSHCTGKTGWRAVNSAAAYCAAVGGSLGPAYTAPGWTSTNTCNLSGCSLNHYAPSQTRMGTARQCPEHSIEASDPNYCISQNGWAWNSTANSGAGAMEPRRSCGVGQSYQEDSNSCSNSTPLSTAVGAGLAALGLVLAAIGLAAAAPIVTAAGAGAAALGIIIGATAGGDATVNEAANPPDSPITVDLKAPGTSGTTPTPINNGDSPKIERQPPTPENPNPPMTPGGGGGTDSSGNPKPGWSTNPDGSKSLRNSSGQEIGRVSADGTQAVINGSSSSTAITTKSDGSSNVATTGKANNSSGGGSATSNYNWYREGQYDVNGNKVGGSTSHDTNTAGGTPVNLSGGVSYPAAGGSGGAGSGSNGIDCPHCATEVTLSNLRNVVKGEGIDQSAALQGLGARLDGYSDNAAADVLQDLKDWIDTSPFVAAYSDLVNPFGWLSNITPTCELPIDFKGHQVVLSSCDAQPILHPLIAMFLSITLAIGIFNLLTERPE